MELDYHELATGCCHRSAAAGTILWLKITTNANLVAAGLYSEPTNISMLHISTFIPSAGVEAWRFTNSLSSNTIVWQRDNQSNNWRIDFGMTLLTRSSPVGVVAP